MMMRGSQAQAAIAGSITCVNETRGKEGSALALKVVKEEHACPQFSAGCFGWPKRVRPRCQVDVVQLLPMVGARGVGSGVEAFDKGRHNVLQAATAAPLTHMLVR